MLTIALTDKAQSDLQAAHDYYAEHLGAQAAKIKVIELLEALEPLRTFPGLGRPSQVPDVRERVFTHHPFVAPYRVIGKHVQILRVLHQHTERHAP